MEVVNEIVMRKISEIKPYVRNPRKNDQTVELLVKMIPVVGFNVPLVIDRAGVIVKGHARYAAAIRLGMEELPCVITDADEETIRLDRITDNKISEFSEWVDDDLLHELDALSIELDFDLEEIGLPSLDLDMGSFEDTAPIGETEEERRARYAAYLEQEAQTEAKGTEIVTQEQLDRARTTAKQVAEKPSRYFKVVCESCGKVMFVKEGEAIFEA